MSFSLSDGSAAAIHSLRICTDMYGCVRSSTSLASVEVFRRSRVSHTSSLISHTSSLLCKSQGPEPCFLRFFVVSGCSRHIFALEDKNPTSAISCSLFYVKLSLFYLSIKKIGYCYWQRTDHHKKPDENGSPTRRSRASLYMTSLFPHFAVPFKSSIRKLIEAYVSRQR